MLFSPRHLSTSLAFLSATVSAQYVPNKQAEITRELQHILLDGGSGALINAVSPCTKYEDPTTGQSNSNAGRQSAAEWIRTAFHDFVTADIEQEGGLDASIGFETNRGENVGPAFNDSLTRFSLYFNNRVSMSDMISLGVVMATAACGGSHVPLRGGRVDATGPGPSGVPQPQDSLQSQLTDFANANFNYDDTVTLTACGHTLGGVHHAQFPQIVPASEVSSTNTDGRQPFDETVGIFDLKHVTDYLGNTGDMGGPMVTVKDTTFQSDLRLFSHDGNSTITTIAQSASYFQEQCVAVFQRMIEVVPGGTQFTPDVSPTTTTNLQPYAVYLALDFKGNMILTGHLRYVQVSGAPAAPKTMKVALINRAGKTMTTTTTASAASGDTGSGIFGATTSYSFTLSFSATVGVSGITANGQTFPLQDSMFVVATLSSVTPTPPPFSLSAAAMGATASYTTNTTVAYLPAKGSTAPATLTATYAIPQPQPGTISPKIDTSTTASLKKIGTSGPYTLYSAKSTKTLSAKQAYGSSVDVAVPGQAAGVSFFKQFIAAS